MYLNFPPTSPCFPTIWAHGGCPKERTKLRASSTRHCFRVLGVAILKNVKSSKVLALAKIWALGSSHNLR